MMSHALSNDHPHSEATASTIAPEDLQFLLSLKEKLGENRVLEMMREIHMDDMRENEEQQRDKESLVNWPKRPPTGINNEAISPKGRSMLRLKSLLEIPVRHWTSGKDVFTDKCIEKLKKVHVERLKSFAWYYGEGEIGLSSIRGPTFRDQVIDRMGVTDGKAAVTRSLVSYRRFA
jgi:hypothetical protein